MRRITSAEGRALFAALATIGGFAACSGNPVIGETTKPCVVSKGLVARDSASTSSTGRALSENQTIPAGSKVIDSDPNSEKFGYDERWQKQPITGYLVLPDGRKVSNLANRFTGPCGIRFSANSSQ